MATLALYAVGAALIIMLLQRIPFIGRIFRFAFSLGLLAFLIFVLLQQAPYQPELSRLTGKLGLDDQKVAARNCTCTCRRTAISGSWRRSTA